MRLVTWNIQWGKGCDGLVDLARIVTTARALADADVYCFQEVSSNFPDLDGGADQPAVLAGLTPGYEPVFRPAVEFEAGAKRQRFGSMILSRLPCCVFQTTCCPGRHCRVDQVCSARGWR